MYFLFIFNFNSVYYIFILLSLLNLNLDFSIINSCKNGLFNWFIFVFTSKLRVSFLNGLLNYLRALQSSFSIIVNSNLEKLELLFMSLFISTLSAYWQRFSNRCFSNRLISFIVLLVSIFEHDAIFSLLYFPVNLNSVSSSACGYISKLTFFVIACFGSYFRIFLHKDTLFLAWFIS